MNKIIGNLSKMMPDKLYLQLMYYKHLHKFINFKNPQTFNEKLQWLKLYDKNPKYTQMVDKVEVKKYLADKLGEDYSIPTIEVWDDPKDINIDTLPPRFVLKCNHDSKSVVICKDKNSFDFEFAKKKLTKKFNKNGFWYGREWPYKNVKPKIFAEKYMEDESNDGVLIDYKFFCFNGVPKIMYISNDGSKETRTDFFDMDFNHLDLRAKDLPSDKILEKPECFEKMKEISKILSKDIPFLRVDFYYINKKIYVGELTFFHNSGFFEIQPEEWDYKLGSYIKLPNKNKGNING